jgi:hypothetical protein
MILESGYCFSHDPGAATERTAARTLGGVRTASRKRRGLDPSELPPLESLEDAERWSAVIAKNVATGALSSAQARAVMHALSLFLKAREAVAFSDRLKTLEALVKGRRR